MGSQAGCPCDAVKTFVAFHHEPDHDDDYLDRQGEAMHAARPGSLVAREGMTLDLLKGTSDGPRP